MRPFLNRGFTGWNLGISLSRDSPTRSAKWGLDNVQLFQMSLFLHIFSGNSKKKPGGNIISEVCSPKICLIESYCNVWPYPFVSSIPHWLLVISILCWSQPLLVRNIPQNLLLIPSGKRLHNYGKIHHFLAGKINELNEDQISAPAIAMCILETTGAQVHEMAVCQNLVPLVNIKIAGKRMFIPLKMVLIGINRYWSIPKYL